MENEPEIDFVRRLEDQAGLLRKMDKLAGKRQTSEATAKMLEKAARIIRLYRGHIQSRKLLSGH